jgi:hypothetical protein
MFSAGRREEVRALLLERARSQPSIVAAAITGSAARGAEDRWSDVDLFFGVADGVTVPDAVASWSGYAYAELGALHHFDLGAGTWAYRAFLLPDLLEVDLGFAPAGEFGPADGQPFDVVFGTPTAGPPPRQPAGTADLAGLCWHHVLHARTNIRRGNLWQAEYWISAVRDHVLTMAARRLGHPTSYAKGADLLPAAITDPLRAALVGSLEPGALSASLRAVTRALLTELRSTDPALADALEPPLLAAVTADQVV